MSRFVETGNHPGRIETLPGNKGTIETAMKINDKVRAKIKTCKALQGKTIFDILKTDDYSRNLAAYIKAQREDREQAIASYKAMRKINPRVRIRAHVIDHFEKWNIEDFIIEYMRILQSRSGCNHEERRYIMQICQQAYNKTVADIVILEFPELKKYFYPKTN